MNLYLQHSSYVKNFETPDQSCQGVIKGFLDRWNQDCKKGKGPDYVKRQYIGNVSKKENGIVALTACSLTDGMSLPLTFEVYKLRERLKDGNEYQTKPQIAATAIRYVQRQQA